MALREEFEHTGHWLFRWRSYLPLLMVGPILLAAQNIEYPGHSEIFDHVWDTLCVAVSFLGLGIRVFTVGYAPKGTSGRNTREQIADVLNTTGMYSIVRHPLYLGNFFIWLGISLFTQSLWLNLVFMLIFWLYYERIMFAEEEFLRKQFGEKYLKWAEDTPAFLPHFKNWRSPHMKFYFKTVLRREYSGFFAILLSFAFLETVGDLLGEGKFELEWSWFSLSLVGLAIYLTLLTLKKKTKLLDVEGR